MLPGARLSAAIEVLADIHTRRRPASDALKDWGLGHRFAGSKDRAAIASLVYDALRRRASAGWIMGEETPRAVLLGSLRLQRNLSATDIAALCAGERHMPEALTPDEATRLEAADLSSAPLHVLCDCPEWVIPNLQAAFPDDLVAQMQALATRAPVDIRTNLLRTSREALAADLAHLSPVLTPHASTGLRFEVGDDGRGPSLQSERAFIEGEFEIQDEGSQLVAMLAGARPGTTVIDLCAGAGGKTLALAASMRNEGHLVATDADPRRLAPIYDRIRRAGVTCADIRPPRGKGNDPLADMDGKADLVLVDAPCTGTGTWRRNPDAKWRLRPGSLDLRINEQAAVLDRALRLLRPGGRLVYVTCSVLPDENDAAITRLMQGQNGRRLKIDGSMRLTAVPAYATAHGHLLTPLRSQTDGFYVSGLLSQ